VAEQDVIDLIKNGLKELSLQMTERFEQVDARFRQIDGRFEQIDGRFKQIDGRFEQVDDKFNQVFVQIEGLRDDIKLVAEGVANVDEKLDRHARENEQQFDDLRVTIQLSHAQLRKRDDELDLRLTVLETARR
jgi:archaellum component FlaC